MYKVQKSLSISLYHETVAYIFFWETELPKRIKTNKLLEQPNFLIISELLKILHVC